MTKTKDWTVAIYVADPEPEFTEFTTQDQLDDEFADENTLETHSKQVRMDRAGKVVEVPLAALQASWSETVDMLALLGDSVDEKSPKWGIDAIEVGLTLGAEGQLFWIAKASAQASVKFTLKRR